MPKLFIVLFFSSFNLFAQINSGTIKYKVSVGEDELYKSMPKEMQEEYKKDIESESYTLIFSEKKSVFKLDQGIENSTKKEYYKDIDSTFSLRYKFDSDFGKLIIKENRNIDWKIDYNESKKINEFTCFKASSSYTLDRGEKKFTFPLIAWFCPEIPVPLGPLGYGNLPGLILELQDRITLYGVTNINFGKIESEIIKPKKGKVITQEEYNSMISKQFEKN